MVASPRSADDRDLSFLAHHQYFRAIKSVVRLSPEQEQACFEQLAVGKADLTPLARQARERLVETYQPLVVHIARRYTRYCRSLVLLDLIQEGNLGLLAAIDQHDPHCGQPFAPFAGFCIRNAVVNALVERDRLIRLPSTADRLVLQAHHVQKDWQRQVGQVPAVSEMAQAMQKTEARVNEVLAWTKTQEVESVEALQTRFNDECDESVLQLIGLYEPSPQREMEQQVVLRDVLRRAVGLLPVTLRTVLCLRYGLNDDAPEYCSAEEVAQRLGCSVKRVINQETRARRHLAEVLAVEWEGNTMRCVMRPEAKQLLEEPCYSWQEAARKLGCGQETLRKRVQAGEIPAVLLAGRKHGKVYPKAAVDRLAAALQGEVA